MAYFLKAFTLIRCRWDRSILVSNRLKRYDIIEIDLTHLKSSKCDSSHEIFQAYQLNLLFSIGSKVKYIFEDHFENTKDDFPKKSFSKNNHSQG